MRSQSQLRNDKYIMMKDIIITGLWYVFPECISLKKASALPLPPSYLMSFSLVIWRNALFLATEYSLCNLDASLASKKFWGLRLMSLGGGRYLAAGSITANIIIINM